MQCYRVDQRSFSYLVDAGQYAKHTNKTVYYDYYDDVYGKFDWTKPIPQNLNELYRARSEQLRSDYDYLILMEDDLMCNENLPELISKYIEECPKDFHCLYIFIPEDQHHKYSNQNLIYYELIHLQL